MVAGGLMSMRRRILENREVPIPELPAPAAARRSPRIGADRTPSPKRRAPSAKPAPSLAASRGKGR